MKRPYLQLPNQIARCPDLKPSEFRVLVALMSVKPCFPSHQDLANWTGLNKNTVNSTLQSLKRKGVISWRKGNSYGRNNEYFIEPFQNWKTDRRTTPKIGDILPQKCGDQNRLIRIYNSEPSEFDVEIASLSIEEIEAKYKPKIPLK